MNGSIFVGTWALIDSLSGVKKKPNSIEKLEIIPTYFPLVAIKVNLELATKLI